MKSSINTDKGQTAELKKQTNLIFLFRYPRNLFISLHSLTILSHEIMKIRIFHQFIFPLFFGIFLSTNLLHAEDTPIARIGEKEAVLSNGEVTLVFNTENKFHIKSIREGNKEWLPNNGMPGEIWMLTLIGPNGVNPEITPAHGVFQNVKTEINTPDSAVLVFTWQMKSNIRETYPIRMYVGLGKQSTLTEWKIEVDLPKGWQVSKTDFPRLTVQRSEKAKAIMPTGWGSEKPLYVSANFSAVYPSHSAGMQLMMMTEGEHTLYFATHDKTASMKTLRMRGLYGSAMLSNEAIASAAWSPENGGTFRMPWNVSIGFGHEGWESCAVNWYRPFTFQTVWGSKSFADKKTPEWLLNADMWLRPHFAADSTWESLKEAIEFFGPECGVHWYRWHQIAYDSEYPEYFPPKTAFPKMVKDAQKMGAHVIPYINGRLWDPASKSYTEWNGKEASCRKADGTLYTEIYPTSMIPNSITCPSSPIWQNIIIKLVDRIQNELQTNGVYIDQIGAAAGMPCWAPNHPHPAGGGEFWHASYRQMLTKVREHLHPGNIIITEDNSECYMDLFDIMLMVNSPQAKNTRIVPLYPLIYSDRMMVNCFLYYPLTEPVHDMRFRLKNALGLLWGTQLGWVKPELLMAQEAKPEAEFLRTLVRFRKKQHDILYGGRFVAEITPTGDNPVISFPDMPDSPVVRGSMWVSPKGKQVIYLVNIDDNPHTVKIENVGEYKIKAKDALRINL